MKITYEPFGKRARAAVPDRRYYYVFASNGDGSQSRLLGIVRRDGNGVWTADSRVFPPVPVAERPVHRTRTLAANQLVQAHTDRLKARAEVAA